MPETTTPNWLNLDVLIGDDITADLAAVTAEAEALEATVQDFAVRAFRVTKAFEDALDRADLPDEVWELVKDSCGAGAAFTVIGRIIDYLEVARLDKPNTAPDWYDEQTRTLREGALA
jgi:hypothetical protein